jgi:kynurenine formamidase
MRLLSYELGRDTPTYPGNPPVELRPFTSIADGDAANQFSLTTLNHNGTHVDAPWHFDPAGRRLDELDPATFAFWRPSIIDMPKGPNELISAEDLEPFAPVVAGADLLLLRTGFGGRFRDSDPVAYGHSGPGFAESAGFFLRQFPALRCMAMDIISAGAPAHPGEAVAFHRAALGPDVPGAANSFVLLAEDCRIDADLTADDLALVVLAPLRIAPSDGAPCTILAFSRQDLNRDNVPDGGAIGE